MCGRLDLVERLIALIFVIASREFSLLHHLLSTTTSSAMFQHGELFKPLLTIGIKPTRTMWHSYTPFHLNPIGKLSMISTELQSPPKNSVHALKAHRKARALRQRVLQASFRVLQISSRTFKKKEHGRSPSLLVR